MNRDNRHFERLGKACEKLGVANIATFGKAADSTVRLIDCHISADGGDVAAMVNGADIVYRVGIPGEHWVMNSLCVLAGVLAAGPIGGWRPGPCDLTSAQGPGSTSRGRARPGHHDPDRRKLQRQPASMRAALSVLSSAETGAGGRRIAVLGDMLELGESAPYLHADLAKDVKAAGLDKVFTVGPLMADLRDALPPELRGTRGHRRAAFALDRERHSRGRRGDGQGFPGVENGTDCREILNVAAGDGTSVAPRTGGLNKQMLLHLLSRPDQFRSSTFSTFCIRTGGAVMTALIVGFGPSEPSLIRALASRQSEDSRSATTA